MLATERQSIAERSPVSIALTNTAVILAFATTIFIAGQIRIPLPFTPVPITLQTFAVYLGAAWLGAGRGVAGPLVFAAVAAAGLPVRSGFQAGLTGATAGYILGWMLAAFLIGRLLGGKEVSTARVAATMVGGSALVVVVGGSVVVVGEVVVEVVVAGGVVVVVVAGVGAVPGMVTEATLDNTVVPSV